MLVLCARNIIRQRYNSAIPQFVFVIHILLIYCRTLSNIPNTENELLNNSVESPSEMQRNSTDIDPNDSNNIESMIIVLLLFFDISIYKLVYTNLFAAPVSLSCSSTSTKRRRLNTNSTNASDISVASTNQLDKLIQIFERRENALNVVSPNDPFDEVDHMLQTAALQLRKMSPQLQMRTLQDIVQMTFSRLHEETNKN